MLNKLRNFAIEYEKGGKRIKRTTAESSDLNAEIELNNGRLFVRLIPETPLKFHRAAFTFRYDFSEDGRFFLNGYQSWTNCREVNKHDRVSGIKPLASKLPFVKDVCGWFGDYSFRDYGARGVFHGYTYAYERKGSDVTLIASLSEDTGFTVFTFDTVNRLLTVEKDLEGLIASDAFSALDVRVYNGSFDAVFDRYFYDANIPKPRVDCLNGYTSWYNYFQKIDRNIILRDMEAISKVDPKPDIFQMDDGWQTAVGDWLSVDKKKFPNGIGEIADAAHDRGMLAGLWLAPFLAEKKSALVKTHPDWLLRGKNGKPLMGNIGWSGAYILDFYNESFRAYLKEVFSEVLDRLHYDLVKLDFLYAVCLYPQNGKSRGQIMAEAMEFLRELVGPKLILGCGVPLGSAFGRVDLCRISADVDLSYRERFISKHSNREIISTRCALENTVFRRQLDGRAFGNDPDVFFLRNENLKFKDEEKKILATVNSLLGSVRFVSDNVGTYDEEQKKLLSEAFSREKTKLISAEMRNENRTLEIVYSEDGNRKTLSVPLK